MSSAAPSSPAAEIVIPVRVYIEDTDAGGIVYYVNYLKFMERARTELLRSWGFAKAAIQDESLLFVVHSTQINYRSPAKLDEMLDVSAQLSRMARSYMVFDQRVERDGKVLCDAQVKVACVDVNADGSMQPHRIPAAIAEAWHNVSR